jgi:hypothetical protein
MRGRIMRSQLPVPKRIRTSRSRSRFVIEFIEDAKAQSDAIPGYAYTVSLKVNI